MTAPKPDNRPVEGDVITPEDVARAQAAWERAQLPQDKKLLDAEPVEDGH